MNEQIIVFGVILSIIFYELTDLSPGGMIVPGYLALFFNNPKRIAVTLGVALATYLIIRFLSRYMILYGRRRFVAFIAITFIFGFIDKNLIIGVLVPGILAQDMDRNGCIKSLSALAILTIFIKVVSDIFYRGDFIGI